MLLNLTVGFQNLKISSSDPKGGVYSLFLGDTIQVTNAEPVVFTEADKALSSISFVLGVRQSNSGRIKRR
jgi:nucleosome binding factor SPN SPT16 subunit